ncbi:choice-of-anchor Q domain-containing protein [Dokdonella fugitiva]|uniref:Parallel beta helix pectate lyase-like protein n=1 Tax=Dokdonella fugitiva TaxID=328517 RepID=A0A4R2HX95_9GAMM|nr:choice-of-anchor Q domain-containing protein [Dokdonella fugitiva]TCO36082.1 hypothetical protein EV148_1143 [Dokdonella fugitiva]
MNFHEESSAVAPPAGPDRRTASWSERRNKKATVAPGQAARLRAIATDRRREVHPLRDAFRRLRSAASILPLLVLLALVTTRLAAAADFCVVNEAGAHIALEIARTNGEPDYIKFRSGLLSLTDGLEYDTEAVDSDHELLYIGGGYNDDCTVRTDITMLDGHDQIMPLTVLLHGVDKVILEHISFYRSKTCALCVHMQNELAAVTVDSARFLNGTSDSVGGALVASGFGYLRVRNSLFAGNESVTGAAALVALDGDAFFINNTITRNATVVGDPMAFYAGPYGSGEEAHFSFTNNIIWGNTPDGSPVSDGYDLYLDDGGIYRLSANDIGASRVPAAEAGGMPNLSVDPQLPACFVICLDQRPSPNSPAVNAGDDMPDGVGAALDIMGLPRKMGAHVDIGAYELDEIFVDGFESLALASISFDADVPLGRTP